MDPIASLQALVPAVPYVVVACLVYLLLNDLLDVALAVKSRAALDHVSVFAAAGRVGFAGMLQAVVVDISARQPIVAIIGTVATTYTLGGDPRALLAAAVIAAAVANVGSLESSTKAKVIQLFRAEQAKAA